MAAVTRARGPLATVLLTKALDATKCTGRTIDGRPCPHAATVKVLGRWRCRRYS